MSSSPNTSTLPMQIHFANNPPFFITIFLTHTRFVSCIMDYHPYFLSLFFLTLSHTRFISCVLVPISNYDSNSNQRDYCTDICYKFQTIVKVITHIITASCRLLGKCYNLVQYWFKSIVRMNN